MKLKVILLLAVSAITLAGCGNGSGTNTAASRNSNAPIKTGITPISDDELAVIHFENAAAFGTIKIELYSNIAPKMVARFKELAKDGVYDGTAIHRVNETVIQGGDPLSKDEDPENDGTGGTSKPNVQAEFSDIPYDAGIVGAARSADPNSANSQFFITLKREPSFNNRYTVFGRVIEGMNNARTIAAAEPKDGERPLEPIRIKTITFEPRSQ